jgi:ABC-type branched-subunit amino acid transport system substrate-binding protein
MIVPFRSKLALVMIVFALLVTRAATRASDFELTQSQQRGKQIYLKGQSSKGITATLGSGEGEFSATLFPCANCHGLTGAGTNEGGLRPPPINWSSLTSPKRDAQTGRSRGSYDDISLERAIVAGVDPDGRKLHHGMPRYSMSGSQTADLISYLKVLGDGRDLDPGLSDDSIRIGAALPMTGPIASIGEDIRSVIATYLAEVNSQGGIYGRRIELVIADSQANPTRTDATRRLVESEGVFALVGSFESRVIGVNDVLDANEVPLIGPVAFSPPSKSAANRQTFYLLPRFFDQARALVDFAHSNKVNNQARQRIAVVCSRGAFEQDAVAGVVKQADSYQMDLTKQYRFDEGQLAAKDIVSALLTEHYDYLFYFGSGNDLQALAGEMARRGLQVPLLSCATMVGDSAFQLPDVVAARSFFSYPSSLPDDDDFKEFLSMMHRARVPLRSIPLQAMAYAAARTFVEGAKDAGRQLSRQALVHSLERLQDFKTGVLPPLSFSSNRRIGSTASYIVKVDTARKQYIRATNRITPSH